MTSQTGTLEMRRQQVMRGAIADGIFTDHQSDGICEQLRREGWLERAAPIAWRRNVSRAATYLPTEKAVTEWNKDVSP